VPRSSYYAQKSKTPSKRELENQELTQAIERIHQASHQIYGAPKIHKQLEKEGWQTSLKRVQRRMREKNLSSCTRKRWKPHTSNKSVQGQVPIENVLARDFATTGMNQKWVTDITYIPTLEDGWCYLSTIQDLHTKKIISWTFGQDMSETLVLDTLYKAIKRYLNKTPLVLHSDQGSQYTSLAYEKMLKKAGIQHSFSKKGCPYDNAGIESFHATLKKEEVYQKTYQTYTQARIALFQYIEGFYNQNRIHSSIDYLTPNQKEKAAYSSL